MPDLIGKLGKVGWQPDESEIIQKLTFMFLHLCICNRCVSKSIKIHRTNKNLSSSIWKISRPPVLSTTEIKTCIYIIFCLIYSLIQLRKTYFPLQKSFAVLLYGNSVTCTLEQSCRPLHAIIISWNCLYFQDQISFDFKFQHLQKEISIFCRRPENTQWCT